MILEAPETEEQLVSARSNYQGVITFLSVINFKSFKLAASLIS